MRLFAIALAVPALSVAAAVCGNRVVKDNTGALQQQHAPQDASGRYIVKFKSAAAKVGSIQSFLKLNNPLGLSEMVSHDWDIIPGIAGYFDAQTLNAFRTSPDVEYVQEDGMAQIQMIPPPDQLVVSLPYNDILEMAVDNDAPWGLGRITSGASLKGQSDRGLSFQYTYPPSAGEGVDVYVVDTGVYITHEEFDDRAKWGKVFAGDMENDGNGHGTHCAATIAGNQFGVAKRANIIAVKALGDGGWGMWSDIISGLDWVGKRTAETKRPSIASLSIGGEMFVPVDDAVDALVAKGVHVVVAAGNNGQDADGYSPARAEGAITVGASGIDDARVWFSNHGSAVDIFAPGLNVISAWVCGSTSMRKISGTSMATPHVAGIVAHLIWRDGNVSPADMKRKVREMGVEGVLSNLPNGTVNLLAHL